MGNRYVWQTENQDGQQMKQMFAHPGLKPGLSAPLRDSVPSPSQMAVTSITAAVFAGLTVVFSRLTDKP